MGREQEEDGAKTKPKHIAFEEVSLDGSDEDDGAVEVSAMPSISFVSSGLFLSAGRDPVCVSDTLPLTIRNITGHLRSRKSIPEEKLNGLIGSSCAYDKAHASGPTS